MGDGVDVKRLAEVLVARRVSTDDLARLTGYRPATVADYVAGRRSTPEAFAVVVELVLKLRPGWLRQVT